MKTFVGRARTRRRRARGLAVAAAAILAVGVGAAIASPPRSAQLQELDGRTWFSTNDGTQLLLVNGISGLIEAAAPVPDGSAPLAFVDGGGPSTLLREGDTLVAVDDAGHDATRLPSAARASFVGEQVLVLEDDARRVRLEDGSRTPVVGAPRPVAGLDPIVDGAGDGWYLAEPATGKVAVRVPRDGEGAHVSPVGGETTRLLRVDGLVYAVDAGGLTPVGGGPALADVASADRTDPMVATATGGRWAWATGSTVHTRSSGAAAAPHDQDLGSTIEALALWHGRVVAVTADGVRTGPAGALTAIPELGPGAALREDGGLLWAATPETAVAIHPDHQRTVLRLADADLSLCVGDCSPAAASSFLEETTPPTTAPPRPNAPTTTTTAPARRLVAEQVPPTVASAATTPAPTTTTAAPVTTTTAPEVVASDAPAPASTLAPVTTTTAAGPREEKEPRRPDPGPPIRLPDVATTTTTEAPPEPDPEPEPTTPETTPSDPEVGLSFNVVGRTGTAEATLRVIGSAEDCGATTGTTTAVLTWEGSDRGSREVLVTWNGNSSRSEESSATIVAAEGELDVTVTVCGVTASDSATVRGLPTPTTDPPPPTTTTSTPTTTTPPTTTTSPTTTTPPPTTPTTPTPPTTTTTTLSITTTTKPKTTSSTVRPAAAGGAP